MTEFGRSSKVELPSVWSHELHDLFLATMCGNLQRVMLASEAHLSLWHPEILLGFDHILSAWLTFTFKHFLEVRLLSLVFISSRGWNLYCMAQSPHRKSHCQTVLWPELPGKQRAEHSRSLEINFQQLMAKPRALIG